MKLTVHVILNSHLDPVWRWTWPQGVDEVLNTARTNCDILDEYPEVVITRGEAWFYDTIERLDPALFDRVKRHVANGRMAPVGGWWIQPDCNLPSAASFRKQAEIGKRYFRERFGVDITVGYNVDSFGHAATLPDFLTEAGYDAYVMMRPSAREKTLPASLFTWESPLGNRVTAFRITGAYSTRTARAVDNNFKRAIEGANRLVGHTMCFIGAGDHGGGPTRENIDYVLAHRNDNPDVEFVFSHPRAFFDAVKASGVELPIVRDELQYHAIGSYSVVHKIKQEMRAAEDLAVAA